MGKKRKITQTTILDDIVIVALAAADTFWVTTKAMAVVSDDKRTMKTEQIIKFELFA